MSGRPPTRTTRTEVTIEPTAARVQEAFSGGTISAGQVDAIADAAEAMDDGDKAELTDLETNLVNAATAMPKETFERELHNLTRILAPPTTA